MSHCQGIICLISHIYSFFFKEEDPGKNKSSVPAARRTRRLMEEDIKGSFGLDSKIKAPRHGRRGTTKIPPKSKAVDTEPMGVVY